MHPFATSPWSARRRVWAAVGLAALLLLLVSAGGARADGDPASDALIAQNVFYPYSSPVPAAEQSALNAEVAAAHRDGVALKVAIIARSVDLGSITALYGQPQRYAAFLDTEISFARKIPLLVVMPNGFGTEGLTSSVERRILESPSPAGSSGTDLARAARMAIARALGRTGSSNPARAGAGGDGRLILLLALVLAALLVAGALVVLRVFFPPRSVP